MIIQTECSKEFSVDSEDYNKLIVHKWYAVGNKKTVICTDIKGKRVILSHLILNYTGSLEVDHKDRNYLNFAKDNLRIATRSRNLANRSKVLAKTASSQYKGVSWNKLMKQWMAKLTFNHKQMYLGCFNNEVHAAKAYDRKAKQLWGEFALLNFPE